MRLIDLTQTLSEESLSYPGDSPGLRLDAVDTGLSIMRLTQVFSLDPHCGTHIDAPLHFVPDGKDVSDLPLTMLPAEVIECAGPVITSAMLPCQGLQGKAVLFSTGWASRAGTAAYFDGYPALTKDTAMRLVEAGVALVGIDTPSVDPSDSHPEYPAHRILLQAGIPIVEGLGALTRLIDELGPVWFAAFPWKVQGLEGSPVRAVALLPATGERAPQG